MGIIFSYHLKLVRIVDFVKDLSIKITHRVVCVALSLFDSIVKIIFAIRTLDIAYEIYI